MKGNCRDFKVADLHQNYNSANDQTKISDHIAQKKQSWEKYHILQFNILVMLKKLSVKFNTCLKFSENNSEMLPYTIFSPQPFVPGYSNSQNLQLLSVLKKWNFSQIHLELVMNYKLHSYGQGKEQKKKNKSSCRWVHQTHLLASTCQSGVALQGDVKIGDLPVSKFVILIERLIATKAILVASNIEESVKERCSLFNSAWGIHHNSSKHSIQHILSPPATCL